jgi:hypothetical protein
MNWRIHQYWREIMVNTEQIKSLANRLWRDNILSEFGYERAIRDWLECNPDGPTVVGLTDAQVERLAFKLHGDGQSMDARLEIISGYLSTQTFSNYNNEGLVHNLDGSVTDYKGNYERLTEDFNALEEEYSKLKALQSKTYTDSEAQDMHICLYEDHQPHLKDQLYQPNWDEVAEMWTELDIDVHWRGPNWTGDEGKYQHYHYSRPKSQEPAIGAGQFWVGTYIGKVKIELVGTVITNDMECDSVTYSVIGDDITSKYLTRPLEEFLAKFQRVYD